MPPPNEVVSGFKLRSPISILEIPPRSPDLKIQKNLYQKDAESAIDFAAADSNIQYNAKHNLIQYNIGQGVYLRFKQRVQSSR